MTSYPSQTKEAYRERYLRDLPISKQRYLDNKELYAERRKECRKDPRFLMVYNAKTRCKKTGVPFDLHYTDLIVPDKCPVLGIPLVKSDGKRTDNSPSIDRIHNHIGYVKGNVAVIPWKANKMKSNMTIEEVRAILEYMETPCA